MVEVVYKPRKPKASPLYQSISDHFTEFESVYEERYQKRYGVLRDVVREVVYKYLGCGDLRKGFARIKCKSCHHEILLAFSCKGRYFPRRTETKKKKRSLLTPLTPRSLDPFLP